MLTYLITISYFHFVIMSACECSVCTVVTVTVVTTNQNKILIVKHLKVNS